VAGQIAKEQEVELLPAAVKLRVRGLQTGGKSVDTAAAGQRTAVNLAGVESTEIQRGMTLAAPGKFRASRRIDVWLELLASARTLKQRTKVHFHAGTAETVGEIHWYEGVELAPGESGLAQIRLQDEVVLVRGDRFIVRQFSPVITIGGGAVLDPLARRATRKDTERPAFLRILEQGTREEIICAMTERSVLGVALSEIVARTGWLESEIHAAAENVTKAQQVRIVSREPLILFSERLFAGICEKLAARVEKFHKENPLVPGIAREELRAMLGKRVRVETFQTALDELIAKRKVAVHGDLVKKPGTEITLTAEEKRAKEQISSAFQKAGLTVPSAKEVLSQLAIDSRNAEKILQILLRDKVLVRVSPELIFHTEALEQLNALLQKYKQSKGERISVPSFKDLTGITRKYAIPLLEYLDRQRVTRRAGDERVIL
jgi:selenocysteine-specific elongation factor